MISFENEQLTAMSAMDMLFFRSRASAYSKRISSIASRIDIPVAARKRISAVRRGQRMFRMTSRAFSPLQASLRICSIALRTVKSDRFIRCEEARRTNRADPNIRESERLPMMRFSSASAASRPDSRKSGSMLEIGTAEARRIRDDANGIPGVNIGLDRLRQ